MKIDFNDMEPDMTTGTSFYESSAVVSLSPRKMSMTDSTMRDAPYAYRSGNTDAVNALLKLSTPAAGFKLVSGTSAADRLHESSYMQSTSHYQPVSFNFLPTSGGSNIWEWQEIQTLFSFLRGKTSIGECFYIKEKSFSYYESPPSESSNSR